LEGETRKSIEDKSPILEVNSKNWKHYVLESKNLVLVEFWHETCPSCKEFDPIYIDVAKEYQNKLKFIKFNVLKNKENRNLAVKYGLTSTPTLIFFCDGKLLVTKEEREGFESKEQFKRLIDEMQNKCNISSD
jgi:thioredoxin 1